MVNCAFVHCTNNKNKDRKMRFFKIPKIRDTQCSKTRDILVRRQAKWLTVINRDIRFMNVDNSYVCSVHFVTGQPAYEMKEFDVDWAPSLQTSASPDQSTKTAAISEKKAIIGIAREQRRRARSTKICTPAPKKAGGAVSRGINTVNIAPSVDGTLSIDVNETGVLTARDVNLGDMNIEQGGSNNITVNPLEPDTMDMQSNKDFSVDSLTTKMQKCEMACQTDKTDQIIGAVLSDLEALRLENMSLKKTLLDSCSLTEENFAKDDKIVNFYTGLPSFQILLALFQLLECSVYRTHRNVLNNFQEFLLVLIRLRLHVPLQDLAYRFKISQATASRIFVKWITVMDTHLDGALQWPGREELQKTMPASFQRTFGKKIAVIIDCFEVFIVRPTSMMARALTWSNYKHHNTAKFLIGISPRGVITYISKAWGGRVSDKYLTENCGFLNKVLPGDYVLADRGFTIADSLSQHNASLVIPAFMKGKSQLAMVDSEMSRKIANLRIHVERVIGLVRSKYKILSGTLPIELLISKPDQGPIIDKIAKVCCALTNLCPSVVSED